MTISRYKDKFLNDCRVRGLLPRSVSNYDEIITRFIKYTGEIDINLLSKTILDDYTLTLYDRKLSKATVGTYLRHIKVFIKYLEENSYLNKDVSSLIIIPRQPKKLIYIYSNEELQKLFYMLYQPGDWLKVRNTLIVSLMLDCGLRLSEITTLTPKSFDTIKKVIRLKGKGENERIVPVGDFSLSLLSEYLYLTKTIKPIDSNDCIFICDKHYTKITTNAIRQFIYKLQESLNFPISSHKLRHNFATNFCIDEYKRTGSMDIYKLKTLLGHSEIITSMRYMHLANQMLIAETKTSHLDLIGLKK